jgi:hypothetical protein
MGTDQRINVSLLQRQKSNQAQAILAIMKPELAKHMTETAIHIAFQDPNEVMTSSYNTEPWEPYTLASEMPAAEAMATTEREKYEDVFDHPHTVLLHHQIANLQTKDNKTKQIPAVRWNRN